VAATDYLTKLVQLDQNKSNPTLVDNSKDLQETDKRIDNLLTICKATPQVFIPDYATGLISVAKEMGDLVSASQDKEVKGMLSTCMNDPSFMDAFKKNNPDLSKKMDELTADASGAVSASDFLKNVNMTSAQKRECLLNGVEQENALSKFDTNFTLDNLEDPGNRKINGLMNAVSSALDSSTNSDVKNKFQEIKEAVLETKDQIKLMNNTPLFDAVNKSNNIKFASSGINDMTDKQIDANFNLIANDPYLAKLLINSNANLLSEFKNQNATSDLFDADGNRIDPNDPITLEKLQKVATLEEVSAQAYQFKGNNDLILNGDKLSNKKTNEEYKTFGDLMTQYGKSLFDKAVSADTATIKRSEKEIIETSTELKDLDSSRENLLSTSGGSKETLTQVQDAAKNLLDNVAANMGKLTTTAVKKYVITACENYKSIMPNKNETTTNWLIKLKLINDVLITTDIEEWINKAVKNKYLNPSMITKVKIDILNF